MSKSQADRLAEKQAETKEKKVSNKTKKKVTLADLRKQAEAARARVAKLEANIAEKENPELASITDRLKQATKEAASFPRFIALREKGLVTKIQAVEDQKAEIAALHQKKERADKRVAKIQAELEAARLELQKAE